MFGSQGYVYLMFDPASRCHKIGYSANPRVRETTLQAEKPVVFMVAAFRGTRRLEQRLHLEFAPFRVRGEWFRIYGPDGLNPWHAAVAHRDIHPQYNYDSCGNYLAPDGVLMWREGYSNLLENAEMAQHKQSARTRELELQGVQPAWDY